MNEARDLSHFVEHLNGGLARIHLAIDGLTCAGCMFRIESGVAGVPNIETARFNLTNRRLAVEWREGALDPARLIDRLAELGYKAQPFDPSRAEAEETREARFLLRCLGVAAFAAMNIMLLSVSVWSGNLTDMRPEQRDFFHWLSALIALPAAGYAGRPFFRSAMRALMSGRLNMDVPITLGVLLALGMSVFETLHHAEYAYFDSAIMLLTFFARRALSRSEHAPSHPRGGVESRCAQGRNRLQVCERRGDQRSSGRRNPRGRYRTGATG